MNIRTATRSDGNAIQSVHIDAFPDGEGVRVAKLAVDLLEEDAAPEILSLVAESDGGIVGHVAFSSVNVQDGIERNDEFSGYILSPLGVRPGFQNEGVGRKLVEHGLRRLAESGAHVVFVYGDPAYYKRYGFKVDAAVPYDPPYPLKYPFGWQAVVLEAPNPAAATVKISCVEPLADPGLW